MEVKLLFHWSGSLVMFMPKTLTSSTIANPRLLISSVITEGPPNCIIEVFSRLHLRPLIEAKSTKTVFRADRES